MLRWTLVFRCFPGPALAVGGMSLVVLWLGGLAQVLVATPVSGDPAPLARLAVGFLAIAAATSTALAVLAGTCAGIHRLERERAIVALEAAGGAPLSLLLPVAALAAAGALAWAVESHFLEPWGRAWVRAARVDAVAAVDLSAGRVARLGDWAAVAHGEGARFAGGSGVGRADRGAFVPAESGVLVRLDGAELVSIDGTWRAHASRVELPVPVGSGRVHPSERSSPELAARLAHSAHPERDTYERWILAKRSLQPVALVGAALAASAASLAGRRPGVVAGALVLAGWALVRVLDQHVDALGVAGAGAALVGAPWLAAFAVAVLDRR